METEAIVAHLRDLVAFDTTSRNSNLPLIDHVEAFLGPLGFACERVCDDTGTKANLWATIGPADVPGWVLSGHTDVVPVDGQEWDGDPFVLTEKDGRLHGRGTCDMKGFLAACLAAAPAMAGADLKRPIHLAFSYDEEVGCVGARRLVERLRTKPVRPLACFVGEPTTMGVVIGHKGKRSVTVSVRGHTVHSSLAPHGVNAVEFAALLVAKIRAVADRFAAEGARDALYDVPYTTTHVGVLRGGTALNIVSDRAEILFEVRAIGTDDPDAVLAEIEAYAREALEPRMTPVRAGTGFTFDTYAGFPGLDTPPDAEVVTLAKRLAGRNEHAKVAYGTEAGLFSQLGGIPTVVIGPGDIAQAHQANEWIAVSELAACGRFLGEVVREATRG
ncbi:acetylornithine deacetylase [Salinarimonas chemoclinalis]|uniref:acetylornithine deacetylase n=1 Tax=Salinarimonas chemoclinalis TaxID=3241599 RepID=UPI003555D22C